MERKITFSHLDKLESESIHIIREAAACFRNPVILYSIGKDSSVIIRLAIKAFYPGKFPFTLLHIDTGYKFKEMIQFRDYYTRKIGAKLIIHKNTSLEALKLKPEDANSDYYIYHKKTKPLLDALGEYGFDAAIGGARREEEKSRAKERIFSVRNKYGTWDPKNQRPELWTLYNTRLGDGESMRIFPLSNWTEADIWAYIRQEKIEVVPLYFAQIRKVFMRNGIYIRVDEFNKPKVDQQVIEMMCRYRTLGCSPSTGAVPSTATTVSAILNEIMNAEKSERATRAIDYISDSSMEDKKKGGYF